ncbi:MAG: ice-binding family protein [Bacteroidales bacterium]
MIKRKVFPVIAMLLIVFLAGCNEKDDITGELPKVISTDPISDAKDITIESNVSAVFNMAMNSSTITGTTFTVMDGTEVVAGTIGYSGTTAVFNPSADLDPGTLYTATLAAEVEEVNGLAMSKDHTWEFTTEGVLAITGPTVASTDPEDNATEVEIDKLILVTFSKPMDPASINSLTYSLKNEEVSVSGTVSFNEMTATFTPSSNLAFSKTYTGTVTTGVKDVDGNALAEEYTFSFTTVEDTGSPMVTSTQPLDNASSVDRYVVLLAEFSEPMDPLTINTSTFTLVDETTQVQGTVSYSGTTAVFEPTSPLEGDMVYTATVNTGATDLAGNALASDYIWSFTTSPSSVSPGAVELGSAGNYVILAKTAITNISTSEITGDLGLSPAATSYITGLSLTKATGYATSAQVTGNIYAADMADPTPINLTTAVSDMITAYNDAAGRSNPDFLELGTGNIGGKTLVAGLYKWTNTVTVPADITISGDANDVWIFQIDQNLTVSNGVNVTLIGGAQAKNIFWQVAGEASFGTTSHFEGIVLSMTGITFQTGASFKGRALAQTAVVLDGNTVVVPE